MFNPIQISENIRNEFIDYLHTNFHIADRDYSRLFQAALHEKDLITKGPYIDIGNSYKTGKTIRQLIELNVLCKSFRCLEDGPEREKELKLDRPLYLHQQRAIERTNEGKSLIVTTGTGSGKTECFLIPIINHLLKKIEANRLEDAVHAILIYPMNALANDQIKRMRALLKNCPEIRFGIYNGNTKHKHPEALSAYKNAHSGQMPLPNEIISREEMQIRPPHILITNYSMMEYMLLRPKDDGVFQNAQLKFIVLDEAHIYRGATGMETSLLLRRMRARIGHREQLQYILTSATLGGKDENQNILNFGRILCGVDFTEDCIIRSEALIYKSSEIHSVPNQMFVDIDQKNGRIPEIFEQYKIKYEPENSETQNLFDLCLNSRQYDVLRSIATRPIQFSLLLDQMNQMVTISKEELIALIGVCTCAEQNGANLIRPRFHFFVRALEGAYVTIGKNKQLFLTRRTGCNIEGQDQAVFEIAVCNCCGRIALVGKNNKGVLEQKSTKLGTDQCEYYLIKDSDDGSEYIDDENEDTTANDFVVCSICGAISNDNGCNCKLCSHDASARVRLLKLKPPKNNGKLKCPICGTGQMVQFYNRNERTTSVLAADLFEQLPAHETITVQPKMNSSRSGIFKTVNTAAKIKNEKVRQFLCFSDSRREAANFPTAIEKSYGEILRKRGIWHTAEQFRKEKRYTVPMADFVAELTKYFEKNESFKEWDSKKSVYQASKENAWVAMLNEMYTCHKLTSLMSMGVFSVHYKLNTPELVQTASEAWKMPFQDAQNLLDLLVLDGVCSGAINAGDSFSLSNANRKSLFYSEMEHRLVKVSGKDAKTKFVEHGWCAKARNSKSYYHNVRQIRLTRDLSMSDQEANEFLGEYWEYLNEGLQLQTDSLIFDANDFEIRLFDEKNQSFYRCPKCGQITPYSVMGHCAMAKCKAKLRLYDAFEASVGNHYSNIYRSAEMKPLYIKEHTAQLSKSQQGKYQEAFVQKKINALSCSTTFEMGVDVGSLETIFMRNMPPMPSNYVQRAGRAGRGHNSISLVMTFCKLASHDFTYYKHLEDMICGNVFAPIFCLENEKIIRRHIFATALGYFFKQDPAAFGSDDRAAFLLEGGYERFKEMLADVPEGLHSLLLQSIPQNMHKKMGIDDGRWVDDMVGTSSGILQRVYTDFHQSIEEMEGERKRFHRKNDAENENHIVKQLRYMRASKEDHVGRRSLIDFLVRNNILPKYGFPVDTVELLPFNHLTTDDDDKLQLSRDLQIAIAEYAPDSEVIADGKVYTSRYIRKSFSQSENTPWEIAHWAKCPQCEQVNYRKKFIAKDSPVYCVSCGKKIPHNSWKASIEPRQGFQAQNDDIEASAHPQALKRGGRAQDCYIGDTDHQIINRQRFEINGGEVILESTANDSLLVMGVEPYCVCEKCGYAKKESFSTHVNSRGFPCKSKASDYKTYYLSHDFKTDVAKITFIDERANDSNIMHSVMFAILEGLSQSMDIERNDIKGCLYKTETDLGLMYSVILYDAVAGGAGNVRRLITNDGLTFQRVLAKALEILRACKCDTSCYNCLRNYYNQALHDVLDRHKAIRFLENWIGEPVIIPEENCEQPQEEGRDHDEILIQTCDDLMADYENWTELSKNFKIDPMIKWDAAEIPYTGLFSAELVFENKRIETNVIWKKEKIAVCDDVNSDSIQPFTERGWTFFSIDADPSDIKNALKKGAD